MESGYDGEPPRNDLKVEFEDPGSGELYKLLQDNTARIISRDQSFTGKLSRTFFDRTVLEEELTEVVLNRSKNRTTPNYTFETTFTLADQEKRKEAHGFYNEERVKTFMELFNENAAPSEARLHENSVNQTSPQILTIDGPKNVQAFIYFGYPSKSIYLERLRSAREEALNQGNNDKATRLLRSSEEVLEKGNQNVKLALLDKKGNDIDLQALEDFIPQAAFYAKTHQNLIEALYKENGILSPSLHIEFNSHPAFEDVSR